MTSAQRRPIAAVVVLLVIGAARADAQTQPDTAADVPSFGQLFTWTIRDFKEVPSAANLRILAVGGGVAIAAHPTDGETSRILSEARALDGPLEPGSFLGGTPFELGAAFATYGLGRAMHSNRMASVGGDLVRSQLIAESLTIVIKEATRRARPAGSGYSFPSGHTTAAFASATVLQAHFGWKAGMPAYAVAAAVGASRVHDRRHYLSDVAFGAALGTVAGRSVTVNRRRRISLGIAPANGGGAVVLAIAPP